MIKNQKAFTFVEILIYMGLLATFIAILGSLLFSILNVQLESVASSDLDHDGQFILARLSYDLRRADSVTTPASLGSISPVLNMTVSGVSYSIATDSGRLTITSSGEQLPLSSQGTQVTRFQVQRIGNPSGKSSFLILLDLISNTVTLNQSGQSRSYQTTVNLR